MRLCLVIEKMTWDSVCDRHRQGPGYIERRTFSLLSPFSAARQLSPTSAYGFHWNGVTGRQSVEYSLLKEPNF